jgi:hypothetical protein
VLAGFDISLRFGAAARLTHPIQGILAQMALDRASRFVPGAMLAQGTGGADFFGGGVIDALPFGMQGLAFHLLAGGADIDVSVRIVAELVLDEFRGHRRSSGTEFRGHHT